MNRYNYLLVRKDYPMENGYRMHPVALPNWIHLTIEKRENSKYLFVHSRIHVDKKVQVGPAHSLNYPDQRIIKEQSAEVSRRFLA